VLALKDFEETKAFASNVLHDVEYEIALLNRTYNNYIKHGAVNAAAELKEVIDLKTQELEAENWVFKMTFN